VNDSFNLAAKPDVFASNAGPMNKRHINCLFE
jgi:hypothetical protein